MVILLVSELRVLLSMGGLRLRNEILNPRNVIESIPISEKAVTVKDHLLYRLPIERELGIRGNVASDTCGSGITSKDRPATRRGILFNVRSVYDPLGRIGSRNFPTQSHLWLSVALNQPTSDTLQAADNSQFAYGALSYFRITDSQSRTVSLSCSQIPTVGAQAAVPLLE